MTTMHKATVRRTLGRYRITLTGAVRDDGGRQIVAEIRPGHCEQYAHWRATEHEVRPITIRHDLHALSLLFQWAIRHGFATANPIDEVPIPSDADAVRQHILTQEEERRYFDGYVNPDDGKRYRAAGTLRDVARLILLQGMRPAEVLSLPKAALDLDRGTLTIATSKTKAGRRTLYLCEEARQILTRRAQNAKRSSPYLFPSPSDPSKPILKVNGAHDRLVAAVGATWVLYDLRHTFATRLKAIGVDDFALAAMQRYQQFLAMQTRTPAAKEEEQERPEHGT
jgi:integrase